MPNTRLHVVLCLLLFAPTLEGAEIETISRAITQLEGQEATFTQRFLPRGYKKEQVEGGTVLFGIAPASRWSYHTPEVKTFVFDGETSWMYVPADETVMVHRVGAEEKRRLPFFVLSDPDRLADWYEITGTDREFRLKARSEDALLRSIELLIDRSGMLQRLSYVDTQGNRTAFDLKGWQRARITDETFTFTPPPGIGVIQN